MVLSGVKMHKYCLSDLDCVVCDVSVQLTAIIQACNLFVLLCSQRELNTMPLLRKQPFVCETPSTNLKPDDLVFYCKLTGELFTDYESVVNKYLTVITIQY